MMVLPFALSGQAIDREGEAKKAMIEEIRRIYYSDASAEKQSMIQEGAECFIINGDCCVLLKVAKRRLRVETAYFAAN